MQNIQAIIFDLDNTLIDRQRAFSEMLYKKLTHYIQGDITHVINDILKWDNNGTVPRLEVFKKLVEIYHISEVSAETLDQDWSKESGTTAYLFDDVLETLNYLKPKYKLAVLSNGNKLSQRRKMSTINIGDYLNFSLISGEFDVNKPDPKIFHYVAEQLNVAPENCVYVGDNYEVDILGSKNAGMQSIYINRSGSPQKDVLSISQIKELIDIL